MNQQYDFHHHVELRRKTHLGCAHTNWRRMTDTPTVVCFVCGHHHMPAQMGAPFCPTCAILELREANNG